MTTLKNSSHEPQNPFISFVVAASAGSGKTYQLSQRFIALVAAGNAPESILTITFTKKAAAEMQSRIMEDATKLLRDMGGDKGTHDLSRFSAGHAWISAAEVGKRILAASQRLRIQTIDGVFWQWLQRFPTEGSALLNNGDHSPIPAAFNLIDAATETQLANRAWRKALATYHEANRDILELILSTFDLEVSQLKRTVEILMQHELTWWLAEIAGVRPFAEWPVVAEGNLGELFNVELQAALAALRRELPDKYHDGLDQCLAERSPVFLRTSKLLTNDGGISGSIVKGTRRERLTAEIATVEAWTHQLENNRRFTTLNLYGRSLWALADVYRQTIARERFDRGLVTFSDLSRAAMRLMAAPAAAPARRQIIEGVSHLLLDEFQDTSRLQWNIFSELCTELLSTNTHRDGPPRTVFIVGDSKQSIYRFRQADARILADAATELSPYGVEPYNMDRSYRTAQVVLDFVNAAFDPVFDCFPIGDFRPHQTAHDSTDNPVVPNFGSVTVVHPFTQFAADPNGAAPQVSPLEQEAHFVAATIQSALKGEARWTVWDKSQKIARPLEARDCAILYRNATHATEFEGALRACGIPVQRVDDLGFFDRQEVNDLIALLRWMAVPIDSLALCQVLKSPLGMLTDEQIGASLVVARSWLSEANRFRSDCLVEPFLKALPGNVGTQLLDLRRRLDMATPQQALHTTVELELRQWVESNDLKPRLLQLWGDVQGQLAKANIETYLQLIAAAASRGITTPLALWYEVERMAAENATPSATGDSNAVTLMTMHKSKGLEFPLVFLVECGESWSRLDTEWLRQAQPKSAVEVLNYIGLKSDMPVGDPHFDEVMATERAAQNEEIKRILYVAMTRARHHLVMTGHCKDIQGTTNDEAPLTRALACAAKGTFGEEVWDNQRVLSRRLFAPDVDKALEVDAESTARKAVDEKHEKISKQLSDNFSEPGPLLRSPEWLNRVAHRDELSPTKALSVPSSLRLLTLAPALAALRGTVAHRLIELQLKTGSEPALDEVWSEVLTSNAVYRNEVANIQLKALAQQLARDFFSSNLWATLHAAGKPHFAPELPIVFAQANELISGQIDLLATLPNGERWIVDFKSIGLERLNKTDDGQEIQAYLERLATQRGHSDQVLRYMAAVEGLKSGGVVRGCLYYLGLNHSVAVSPLQ